MAFCKFIVFALLVLSAQGAPAPSSSSSAPSSEEPHPWPQIPGSPIRLPPGARSFLEKLRQILQDNVRKHNIPLIDASETLALVVRAVKENKNFDFAAAIAAVFDKSQEKGIITAEILEKLKKLADLRPSKPAPPTDPAPAPAPPTEPPQPAEPAPAPAPPTEPPQPAEPAPAASQPSEPAEATPSEPAQAEAESEAEHSAQVNAENSGDSSPNEANVDAGSGMGIRSYYPSDSLLAL